MKNIYPFRFFLLLFAAAILAPTTRGQELQLGLGKINALSDAVVRARAESVESHWSNEDGYRNIVTTTTFRVLDGIRGNYAQNDLFDLKMLGGRVGDTTQLVTSSVAFMRGEEAILFLQGGTARITGGEQGRIPVFDGLVYLENRPVSLTTFTGILKSAGQDPQALDNFVREVRVEPRKIGDAPGSGHLKSGNSTTDTWAIYGRKAAFNGEVDNDGDGYYETFSFQIQVDGDASPGPTTVYFRITCTTTGQVWESTNSYVITGTVEDYYNFAFDQSDFTGKITGNMELAFTVDLLDESKSSILATDTGIEGDLIKVDEPTNTNVAIGSISPDRASAGTGSTVTISGTGFGASQGSGKVEFFYRSGQPKMEAPVTSWSDTQIVCTVPIATIDNYPASAGSGPVTVTTNSGIVSNGYPFRVTFSFGGPRWAGNTVTYKINENLTTLTGEGQCIQNAANSWNAAGSNFHYQYDGTHSNTSSSGDGANEIMWAPLANSSTIGQASVWYSGGYISECDIVFNSNLSWNSGSSSVDIETIALHELGHWLNLRDIYGSIGDGEYDQGKVMYGYSSYGDIQRTLHADDLAGIQWIYGTAAALTVSGSVRTGTGTGISGVTLSGLPGNPQTGSNGSYSCEVPQGWSGTVTPQKAGYTFSPSSRTYSNLDVATSNEDYTGSAPSSDATLADLRVDGATVSGFLSTRLIYSIELPAGASSVPAVTATTADANATRSITPATSLPGTTTVIVTAQDGITRKTYSVSFTLAANDDATLADLRVDGATIGGFAKNILEYNYSLPYGTTAVPAVTANPTDANASAGVTAASSLPGTTTILVTAEDGVTTKTYRVNFNLDQPSSDATLADLQVNGISVTAFQPSRLDYSVDLPSGTSVVPTVTATTSDAHATKSITPASALPGTTTVEVTAQDGVTRETYTLRFSIAANDDATLSNLMVDGVTIGGFSPNLTEYHYSLPYGTLDVPQVTAITTDSNATSLGTPATSLPGTTSILVTAEDGVTTETYSVNFILDPPSSDALLSDLRIDDVSVPGFDPAEPDYQSTLPHGTTIVPVVRGFVNDDHATLVVTPAVSLPGTTTVVVTAQDGTTQKVYSVEFRLAPNDDATLAEIRIDGISVPDFESNTLSYNMILPAGSATLPDVTAFPNDPNATAQVSLPEAIPGTADIQVIAEDGISTLHYEVFISLAANGTGAFADTADLSIYPNPNRGSFVLSYPSARDRSVRIQIIDLTGRMLYDREVESGPDGINARILIPGIHPGTFFVRMIDGDRVTCGKVIVE